MSIYNPTPNQPTNPICPRGTRIQNLIESLQGGQPHFITTGHVSSQSKNPRWDKSLKPFLFQGPVHLTVSPPHLIIRQTQTRPIEDNLAHSTTPMDLDHEIRGWNRPLEAPLILEMKP